MKKINLEKLSLKELMQLQKDIDAAMGVAEKTKRADAVAAAEAAAAKHGFTLSELLGDPKKPKKKAPAPAKYAHPENPAQTWSGRGRQPAWIKEVMAKGKSMDAFLIAK